MYQNNIDPSTFTEFGPHECQSFLDEIKPDIGNYGWMWSFLRACMRKTRVFPWTAYRAVLRLGNPRKPYFVGTTQEGIKFLGDYRDWYAVWCAIAPDYDSTIVNFLQNCLQGREGAYLDVGTNLGIVAATLARRLEGKAEVFAFEPLLNTAKRAAGTFALNGLTNVRLLPCAVGDEDTELTFYYPPGHSEGASANPIANPEIAWSETKVACRTLDSLVQQGVIGKVALAKFDVEGHELKALAGSRKLIARERPVILCEFNYGVAPKAGWTAPDLGRLLSEFGQYHLQVLHDDNRLSAFPPPSDIREIVNIYCNPS